MRDKIQIRNTYEPNNAWLLERAKEKPVRKVFTIDVHGLDEEGPIIDGYPDFELRNSDLRMRITIPDGMSRWELVFYLSELMEEIREDCGWNGLTFDLWASLPDEPSDESGERNYESAS